MRLLAMAIQDRVIAGDTNVSNVVYGLARANGEGIFHLKGESNVCFNINPNSALGQPRAS